MTARGTRNNNPGNLQDTLNGRPVPFTRSQLGYIGSDGRFGIFDTMAHGIAAQVTLLGSYIRRGYDTVSEIIWRYGNDPGTQDDANVRNYISYVSRRLGVTSNTTLSTSQSGNLGQAMREFETGNQQSGTIVGNGNAPSVLDNIREFERWTIEQMGGGPDQQRQWTDPNANITDMDPTGISGAIVSIFSPGFATRFVAVFIGIVLIGLAIAAFVLTSDNASSIGKAIPNAS